MITLREMVSEVRSGYNFTNNNYIISDRFIASELRAITNTLVKQQTDKRKLFSSDSIFTELTCIEMMQVPLSECCNYISECTIARSKNKLPKIGVNIYGPLIQGIYTVEGNFKFDYMDPDRYANILKVYPNKKNILAVWIKNSYIYITNPLIEELTINAYFEDDFDLESYSCNNQLDCPVNPLDREFKHPGYLRKDIVNFVRDVINKTYNIGITQNNK